MKTTLLNFNEGGQLLLALFALYIHGNPQ